ncbi:MAG: TIGR01777 family oxidoreductase [Actinomycetota bacterium]
MKFVIAGGSGTLGRRMSNYLSSSTDDVVILTRSPRSPFPYRQVEWDGRTVGQWAAELDGSVLINLAGELVDRRPTKSNIDLLRSSRVQPTRALAQASRRFKPALWVQASSTAIYGDAGEAVITEEAEIPTGPPQMPGVALPWEQTASEGDANRQVFLRMSIVLDTHTPVLDRLALLVKLGLGGRISSGQQWISWIHVRDMLRALRFVIDSDIGGVVNVTSPSPVRNETLMKELRAHLHRPWSPPTPAALVKLGGWLIGSDPAIALTGRRCIPARLMEQGFEFELPELADALDDLFGTGDREGTAGRHN